jgi:hypothetical protein
MTSEKNDVTSMDFEHVPPSNPSEEEESRCTERGEERKTVRIVKTSVIVSISE